ncbi:Disease resistance protein (TIR-NBS-LRR class) family [Arabidopsis thaliana]|uniref:ADP-ribosyl cyclase/cyclic ADP-ribose hydrolase n=2 Tax=Arabidopsis thaliana TaxID=3702 RepID=A0A1P8B6H3_ARATH|nr:Disease resistance protein (TIR-NBS-LRR class) family [Arabidopsis thaliana]NP_001329043.1 Disease resistance protein (TIR-NBS-LRR class) family [Arabidopsis thaliana]ANM67193.1 Disease resistance protein (TIR-NBS-LRR class) family [Arabidopsis thaliana]ANM67199.1 Disease resistance protein (TIR-NBS-LRR class) family [Arabidopsis thaliana]|eukprot:NP_001329037.1 Disease resistance protein (TIR-NBS-LRR class) family [Arabidopsis thaliana]
MAAASSSGSDIFPSFSGEDVRKNFLSHLLKQLNRRSINTFMDHVIERSCIIADALISAIREARISIVIFSKNYAASTWCLNELVEIDNCSKYFGQKVIPVFYDVDPSHVRKQIGEFGKVFKKTCEDKPADQKQRWVKALTDISNIAGEDLRNGPNDAHMVEKIANDVSNKLFHPPKGFGDLVGIEDHIEAIKSILCLESKEAKIMVGIWGQSGIGKSTIGRALFSQLSSQFPLRAFVTYKSTSGSDVSGMKLSWQKELLSEILGQKDIKIDHFGVVEQRLKHKKVLILLDDVDNLEFLKTLVGKAEWFGSGSRIIVITQDRQLLKAHEIDLVYEVKLPSQGLALQMISQYAFGKDSPPDDFKALAFEVAELAGSLPLGLSVLGSSLKGRDKDEWVKMMPRLRNDSDDKIEETLRVCYDRLNKKNRELFKCIACFFNGFKVSNVKELLEDDVGLTMLVEKSLIRITPDGDIEMHNLLEKLGREIDRAKSKGNPGKRQFLTNFEDIQEVLAEKTGTEILLGIRLPHPGYLTTRSFLIDEKLFKGMRNLQYLEIGYWSDGDLPQSLVYLPLKLRLLEWVYCPLKSLPSTFRAEYLVKLIMKNSKLEKLWEGTLPLGSLKKMNLWYSKYFKEIPDLSLAINLEELNLSECESLVTLPSSIQNAIKLRTLYCSGVLLIDLKSLEGMCNLEYLSVDCSRMEGTQGIVYFPSKLRLLLWNNCPLKRLHSNFKVEYLVKLRMENSDLEKLWDGTQPLGRLKQMFLRGSKYLKEIPDLSLAINLEEVDICKCESLVTFPSSMQNAIKLIYLDISDCKKLESFPTDLNLESLEYLNLTGCPNLRNFPAIKMGCSDVDFPEGRNEIVVEDCFWNKNLPAGLDYLDCLMRCMPCEFRPEYLVFLNVRCYKHEKLWEGIQSLGSLEEMDLSESENLTEIPDLSKATNLKHLYLNNCKSLVTLPSTIGNLQKLVRLEMKECTGLEVLPTDVNLSSLETLDLSGCSSLRTFPLISKSIKWLYLENTAIEEILDLSKATKLESLILNNCKSLVTLPSTIGNLQNLRRLYMKRCTGLEVLPTDVNLSSLGILDLSGCSSLRTFPLISTNIVWLYLENTAIGEVPCCIEDFTRLRVLLMYCCQRLKNISPNIFRLRSLMFADFTDCRGVIKALSDATVVATMEDHVSCVPLSENIEYTCERFWDALYDDDYKNYVVDWRLRRESFSFCNCFKLERDARELILRSCFKHVALPGGEIPKYFTYRAYGDSLTVTLPQSSLSQYFFPFKACVVVEPPSEGKGFYPSLKVNVGFNGKQYQKSFFEDADLQFCKTDHLFFCSFKIWSEWSLNFVAPIGSKNAVYDSCMSIKKQSTTNRLREARSGWGYLLTFD